MLDVFARRFEQNSSVLRYSEFDYVRRSYLRELANIEDYYHNRVYAVKSNHLLSMLLTHINVPMQYETGQYVNVASARAPYLAKAFKLTSELQSGQLFDGVFYGPGTTEIILANEDYFNPFYAEANWERISAVQVLLHPKSDVRFLLPNGKLASSGDGLAVLSINIPLLALQYKRFCEVQAVKIENDAGGLGVSHFIHMYVLPNMLYSHSDIVIMNRLMNLFYGAPMSEPYLKHPFPVLNYTNKIDKVLSNVIDRLQSQGFKLNAMLQNIPTIVNEDMQEALLLPEIPETRQVQWALVLSRLSITKFLLDVGEDKVKSMNFTEINTLQRTLKRLKIDHVYDSVLPEEMAYETNLIIDEILAV